MQNKPSMLMFVYNDLKTDSRVQRSLETLGLAFDITILSTGVPFEHDGIKNIIVKSNKAGVFKYFDVVRQVIHYGKNHEFKYLYLHDYYSCLVGLGLHKNHKTVYDAHELIINTREYPASKRERFFGFFERQMIKKAQLVICAEQKRADFMKEYYKLSEPPFVVPNFSELPVSEEFSLTSEMIDFFGDSRKTFVYAGALVEGRHIDSILAGTSKVSDDYKVLIIGEGGARQHLESIAKNYAGLKYLFTGSVAYKDLSSLLKRCDVGFLSYPKTDLNNIYCAPNKIYEYASVELPMICNDNPNLLSIVGNNGIGVCVSKELENNCAGTIEEALAIIDQDYDKYKENIQFFRQANTWDSISKGYLARIKSI